MVLPTVSILGCGWLGFPLASALVKQGFQVHGSTTTAEKCSEFKAAGIVPFRLECAPQMRGDNVEEFFQSDILIVTIPFRCDFNDPQEYQEQINSIVHQVEHSPIKFVIFTSSTSVYPRMMPVAVEDKAFAPDNGRSKVLLLIEQSLLHNSCFKATVIRFAGLCGGNRQAGRSLSGQKNLSGGEEPVNLIHRDDCIEIILEIIRQGAWGEIFNACADQHPSRKELYTAAAKRLHLPPPVFVEVSGRESGKIVSNEKIRRRLNYRFKYPNPLEF